MSSVTNAHKELAGIIREEGAINIFIGGTSCIEFGEERVNGELCIYIPLPYNLKQHPAIANPDMDKFVRRVMSLLVPRFPIYSNLIFHFNNDRWWCLAQRLKTELHASIVCESDGIPVRENNMQEAMLAVADRIICRSGVTRSRLLSNFNIPENKISVVYDTGDLHVPDNSGIRGGGEIAEKSISGYPGGFRRISFWL